MKLNSKFFIFFLLCIVMSSCGDDDDVTDADFAINSSLTRFDLKACAPELRGSIISSVDPSEIGVVYSYENLEPDFTDIKVEFTGEIIQTEFSIFVEDYKASQELFWRAYAIVNGEVFFGRVLTFVESRGPLNSSFSLEIAFDCSANALILSHNLECPFNRFKYDICLQSLTNTVCTEYTLTTDQLITIPTESDVLSAEMYIFRSDSPENKDYVGRLLKPEEDIINSNNLSPLPLAVGGSTGVRVGDFFYMCGGYTESSTTYTDEFWRYDIIKDEWMQLENFPGTPRALMTSVALGNTIYIGTGRDAQSDQADFYSYNINTMEWQTLRSLPKSGQAGVSFVLDDKVYVTNLTVSTGESNPNEFFVYDLATNIWAELKILPFSINNDRNMAVVNNQQAYIVNTFNNFMHIYQYDASADSWDLSFRENISCKDGVAVIDNNTLYITTGRGMDGIYKLDLTTFESQVFCATNPQLRAESVGTVYNDKLYIFGGLVHDLDGGVFTEALQTAYSIDLPN